MIPGWPYSFVAALEPGRTSWTLPLDAVRLGPDDDLAAVTAAQVRDVVTRLAAAGHWNDGDPDIMVIFDAGYERPGSPGCCATFPCRSPGGSAPTGCSGSPPPPRRPGQMGRPVRHGAGLRLAADAARPEPDAVTATATSRYGTAAACSWNRAHPKLKARGAWEGHQGEPAGHRGHPHPAHRRSPAP